MGVDNVGSHERCRLGAIIREKPKEVKEVREIQEAKEAGAECSSLRIV